MIHNAHECDLINSHFQVAVGWENLNMNKSRKFSVDRNGRRDGEIFVLNDYDQTQN